MSKHTPAAVTQRDQPRARPAATLPDRLPPSSIESRAIRAANAILWPRRRDTRDKMACFRAIYPLFLPGGFSKAALPESSWILFPRIAIYLRVFNYLCSLKDSPNQAVTRTAFRYTKLFRFSGCNMHGYVLFSRAYAKAYYEFQLVKTQMFASNFRKTQHKPFDTYTG